MIVHQIVPRLENQISLKELCDEDFFSQPCEKALSSKNIGFFDDLSREIFKNSETKQYPELHALAFWLRKSNLTSIVNTFKESLQSSDIIIPRGIALHIAPANVDSIFLYSWALSMLAGNINMVRVSQKQSDQIILLFQIIREIFQESLYQEFAQKNIVLTYDHDQAISSYLSQKADIRFLWGGDETIQLFRSYLTKTNTKDVTFVDNDSKALIVLKKNINDLKINEKTTIFSKKIEDFINNFKGKNKFNIVFLDPPFAENFYIKDLELIKKSKICNSNNLVIIHREKKTNDKIDSCLSTLLTKIYGRSKIIFGVLR